LLPLFATGAADTCGQLAAGFVDTGGKFVSTPPAIPEAKFAAGDIDTGGKFATGGVDTRGAP
jgi:hypothetical protein